MMCPILNGIDLELRGWAESIFGMFDILRDASRATHGKDRHNAQNSEDAGGGSHTFSPEMYEADVIWKGKIGERIP